MSTVRTPSAPPLVAIGGELILAGHRFEVVGHTTDRYGRAVEVPGKCLGRASKNHIAQHNTAGGSTAIVPTTPQTHASASASPPSLPSRVAAPPVAPSPPSPAPAPPPRPRAARRSYNPSRYYPKYKKPPPLVIQEEPASAGVWLLRVAFAALVVAGIWLWNQAGRQDQRERLDNATKILTRR